jgi:hypothetical protein
MFDNQLYDNISDILDISDRQGWTGYIDFIKADEMTAPIMKGVDINGRNFLCLKVKGEVYYDTNTHTFEYFQTFFQRYSDDMLWMGCGNHGLNFIQTLGGMSAEQFEFINKLLKDREIIVDKTDYVKYRLINNISDVSYKVRYYI